MITVHLVPFSPQSSPPSSTPTAHFICDYSVSATLALSNHNISAKFVLSGDTAALRWPALAATVTQGKDLWKHTCFEIFLAEPGKPTYWEYNFSPSRQWAVYGFDGYRQPAPYTATSPPIIEPPYRSECEFVLQVRINLAALVGPALEIGVCAIIESMDGQRYYYALSHCGKKPDFHLRESFVLKTDGSSLTNTLQR